MTDLAGLLRGLQDSGEARPRRSPSATTAAAPPVVIINEAMAKQFWPKRRSAERSARDRQGRRCASSRTSRRGRSSASSATSATAGSNSDPRPAMYVPQAQVPDARQRAERRASRRWRGSCGRAVEPHRAERRDPGAAAAGDAACRSPTCGRWTRSSSRSTSRAAVQHAADDGLRLRRRCCWRRSASTA